MFTQSEDAEEEDSLNVDFFGHIGLGFDIHFGKI